ncbi:MAG: phosphatidylserine decarboxylase family protein [Spirochaetota bacterium]
MHRNPPVAREAFPYLGACALLFIIALWLYPWASILPGVLLAFCAFFFRDPKRKPPRQPDIIVSPADGRILEIGEVFEERFLKEPAFRISIFLSLLDVHINRSPIYGRVVFREYRKGRFQPAFTQSAVSQNESNLIGLSGHEGRALIVQIAGKLARRIECRAAAGDVVRLGQRIGMIRFGSRVELFLPRTGVQLLVSPGDRVRGGETIIGRWTKVFI